MSEKIPYTTKKSKRAKRIRLSVYGDGSVVVTLPQKIRGSIAEEFIEEKKAWILKKISLYKQFANTNVTSALYSKSGRKDYLKHKEVARLLVVERVEYFNKIYNHSYNKIFIRNHKTRWGSCSSKGNLNFNYKILFLPEALRDYVIVHELCHLKEFNHSKDFWSLVSVTISDHSEVRKKLMTHGLSLIW